MWTSLETFVDKINTAENRCRHDKLAGLQHMCAVITDLGWWNKLVLKFRIWWQYEGEKRRGYLSVFEMHRNLQKLANTENTNGTQSPSSRSR